MNKKILCQEGSLVINGLNYAYKEWTINNDASTATIPILALHGWLDNASSFDHLIPELLKQYIAQGNSKGTFENTLRIVALDLAGHGLSDHRHPQGHYNIWNDLIDLALIADSFGWERFTLLGHSRGAMISTLLASSLPRRIDKLVLIDGFLPMPEKSENAPKQLSLHVKQHLKAHEAIKKLPTYKEKKEAIKARCRAIGMTPETAAPIVERGVYLNDDQKYQWRSDHKLTLASALKLSKEQNEAFVREIKQPVLLIGAGEGIGSMLCEYINELDFEHTIHLKEVAGASHHLHLEHAYVPDLATTICSFLDAR